MVSMVMDLRGEPTASTFLNQYSSQLHSKYLAFYPHTYNSCFKDISLSTKRMNTITENHN